MLKHRALRIGLLLGATALLTVSCVSSKPVVIQAKLPVISQSQDGYDLELKFLDEQTLEARFGKENNPFISPPSLLKLNKIMVFELALKNTSGPEAQLKLDTIELQFGGKVKNPVNRFHLSDFWETIIKRSDQYRSWNYGKVEKIINKTVYDNKTSIDQGSTLEGLIVFMGNLPQFGTANIYIPFVNEKTELLKFKFTFDF